MLLQHKGVGHELPKHGTRLQVQRQGLSGFEQLALSRIPALQLTNADFVAFGNGRQSVAGTHYIAGGIGLDTQVLAYFELIAAQAVPLAYLLNTHTITAGQT